MKTDVIKAIDSERAYQRTRWNEETTEWLVYMRSYVNEGLEHLSRCADNPTSRRKALDIVRKATALGVACMDDHGAPERTATQRFKV
jgi:hypothetical protein